MTRLDEIKGRLGKATPGPWAVPHFAKCGVESVHEDRSVATTGGYYSGQLVDGGEAENEANASFIANAPADIAWLVGKVERLGAALEHIREYWNGSETNGAMSDALEEILATAYQALMGVE